MGRGPFVDERPPRVFLLGAYRSTVPGRPDLTLLEDLRDHLCSEGLDAFLAIDDRAADLLGEDPPPLEKTLMLAQVSDLLLFVLTRTSRPEGVVAELATLQSEDPSGAPRRIVFHDSSYEISSVLDPGQKGILGRPPVPVVPFEGRAELLESALDYAHHLWRYGRLP